MKKIAVVLAVVMGLFGGCKPISNLTAITVDLDYTQQVQMPAVSGYAYGTPLPAEFTVGLDAIPVPTNSAADLSQYHTSANNLTSVMLKSMNLQITAPTGQNFDFLDSIQIYLSGTGLTQQLMAYDYNIPKGQTTITLTPVAGFNIKPYFLLDTMYVGTTLHINAIPQTGTAANINSVFTMVANPL